MITVFRTFETLSIIHRNRELCFRFAALFYGCVPVSHLSADSLCFAFGFGRPFCPTGSSIYKLIY